MKRVIVLFLGMTVILPAVALGGRLNSEVIEAMGKGAEAKIVLKMMRGRLCRTRALE